MVLTNFEFWAADGSSSVPSPSLEFETTAHHHTRHLNPFDPRVVPHVPTRNMTHLTSSNGYYGFSYINAAHDMEMNNNNNNNIDITNNNNNNSNNNTSTHNFMANDVNGMNNTPAEQQPPPPHIYANFISSAAPPPAGNVAIANSRCKKRFFVVNTDECSADGNAAAYCKNASAKRCRFDDDFAQYCNDFFSLPSTQIATQSCLMDTEEGILHQQQQQQHHQQQQLHQQQADEAMFENNNNNICNNNNNNNNNVEKYEQSILHLQLQQQDQQSQMQTQQPPTLEQQQQQQQQQHPYHPHQQQHYQGHLHRANRDT